MAKVKIYTTAFCPYCVRAKQLMKSRGVDFEEVQFGYDDDDQWEALRKKSGMTTVPQIFSGDQLIGGYTELAELDQRDGLQSIK